LATDRQESTPATIRIDVRRALKRLLFTLVFPVALAITVDLVFGVLPIATIVVAVTCIPLATIVVNRTLLAEMDRVVAIVAPEVDSVAASQDGAGQEVASPGAIEDGDRMVEAAP
jgi:hypothetical protein